LRIGLWLTAAAVVAVVVYLQLKAMAATPPQSIGQLLFTISVADIGQFISGVAGALAFLWLVLAYQQQNRQLEMQQQELKLQRRELKAQREETARLADEAKAQVEELKLARAGATRDAFVRALELYERQLAQVAAVIFRASDPRPARDAHYQAAWQSYEHGDRHIFFKRLLAERPFVEAAVRGAATEAVDKFCLVATAAMRHACSVDQDMVNLCKTTAWHALYELLIKKRQDEKIENGG
jgi:hypothetical protein